MELSERTKVPLWLAITAIGGAATWLTTMSIQTSNSAERIEQLEHKIEKLYELQSDVTIIKQDVRRVLKKLGE